MLSECKDLDGYFQQYGDVLGNRAMAALQPLHMPGKDKDVPGIEEVHAHVHKTRPGSPGIFGRQRDTISGKTKALRRQKGVFLAAKPGTGKSLMGAATAHVHAGGKAYRALVMCPDHLIKKWVREIERTCPGVKVRMFDDWREMLKLVDQHGPTRTTTTTGTPGSGDTKGPVSIGPGPHYEAGKFIDQPYQTEERAITPRTTSGVTVQHSRAVLQPQCSEWWIVGRDQCKGDPTWETRVTKKRQDYVHVATCPRCGHVVSDKEGNPKAYLEVIRSKKKLECKGVIERYFMEGDDCKVSLRPCKEPLWQFVAARTKEEREARKIRRTELHMECGTAPYRWPMYRSIKGRMNKQIDYLLLDEVHELKGGDDVAQANAAGAFISRSKKVIALTGTIIGGYADHLFPIMMRMCPQSLVADGFGWEDFSKFNAKYGRIETVIHTKVSKSKNSEEYGRSNSHSKGKTSTNVRKIRKPGIMPQLYGDHLIDKCVFLSLEEVSEGLPSLMETIIPIALSQEQEEAYRPLEGWLRSTVKQMMAMGDKRLLATMLENLLYYPDHPYGWPTISTEDKGSFDPVDLDPRTIYPKEETLKSICLSETAQGRQTWVYIQRVNDRDVAGRIHKILTDAGLRSAIMRSSVSPREREEWIYKKGRDLDVCISHPDLVKTGLDLFAPDGNHNFPTLVFHQTGYQTFTMMQAKCRSWRIGQTLPCKTIFLYYRGSMQELAMGHIGKKTAACEAIDGKFSADGLAAMAGDEDATMALAKALVDRVKGAVDTSWTKNLGFDQTPVAAKPRPIVVPQSVTFTQDDFATLARIQAMMKGAS